MNARTLTLTGEQMDTLDEAIGQAIGSLRWEAEADDAETAASKTESADAIGRLSAVIWPES